MTKCWRKKQLVGRLRTTMKNASLRGAPPHEPSPRRLSVTSIPPSALCPPRSTWFFTLSFVGHLDCFSCLCPLFPEQLVVLGLSWPMFDDRQQKLFEIGFKCWQIASLTLAWWRYTLSISHWDVSLLCVVSSAASSQVGKKQWQAAGGSRHASQTLIHIIVTISNIVIFNICPSSCYSPLHHHHHRHQKQQHHQAYQKQYSQQHCSDTVHVFMDLHLGGWWNKQSNCSLAAIQVPAMRSKSTLYLLDINLPPISLGPSTILL